MICVVPDESCPKEATTSPTAGLKTLTKPVKPRQPAPATVESNSSAVDNNLGPVNQNEMATRCNKYKLRSSKTETPKSALDETTSPGPSGISAKGIASNENQSKRFQSNRAPSTPSNPLFDQKTPVPKQKPPAAQVPSSSVRPVDRLGASSTIPIVQNVQEHNV